jgi:peptidoglycan/xylan/chitin deacetylase (PgdA/CDA1 family)
MKQSGRLVLIACARVSARTFALVYHDIAARAERDAVGFPGPVAGVYKLEPERFTAHLDAIAANGVQPDLGDPFAGATLTFDDGGASVPAIADELERHGWRGAFFVVTGRLGTPGFIDGLTVRELAGRGHEIGSHSHTHPSYMSRLSAQELAFEWATSRELLGELLGRPPRSAAVPGGSVSGDVIAQVAAAGYEILYTSTPSSRPVHRGQLTVVGRNTIWANDPPELAAALIGGKALPRARRWLSWQLKAAAKRVSASSYEAVRARRARLR